MKKMENLTNILDFLAITFDATLTDNRVRIYHEILKDLSMDSLNYAIVKHLRCGKGFPAPSEIREWAQEFATSQHNGLQQD
jgi:hypothetical protein